MSALSLPSGLTSRPLTLADAPAVFAVIAEQEQHDVGTVEVEEADLVADWGRPSYDLGASSVAVLDGERIVAYAEHLGEERYDAAVAPAYRGRGIGSWLAHWIRRLARERGVAIVGMPVPEDSAGDRLLGALGYHVRWTSWMLRLPEGAHVAERPLPTGYRLREAAPADRERIWIVTEDAFLEWSVRERTTLDDFAAQVWGRPGAEPWHLHVVTGPDGDVVAAAHAWNAGTDTYVSKLAVAREHRRRGVAQALLVAAFAAGCEHGATSSSLSTDSRTGALSLYENVGMRVTATWVHRAIALT
ncbi:GNAT family N-acetyltransferase [Nocardioides sp. LHD-245]|uniref:GNAT family N-acetyltransferase n=1 Tax=Nocardioides sp. LHD-245 TaxID=3051387 RepID=UPI0027DF7985|nr:GNAT family N-acetyltransferase [Nocardioides sp. LHD-245]